MGYCSSREGGHCSHSPVERTAEERLQLLREAGVLPRQVSFTLSLPSVSIRESNSLGLSTISILSPRKLERLSPGPEAPRSHGRARAVRAEGAVRRSPGEGDEEEEEAGEPLGYCSIGEEECR